MARGGLYKSDIQKARDALRAQGKHPSVDAVRVALGNTGSKTTIHRYLKELEEEEGQGLGAKVAVSEALQDLVSRLAGRLHEDLTTRLAEHEAHARSLEEKHQHAREALEHYRTSVKEQRDQEQRRHEHQVQELQVALRQANEALTAKNHELLQLNRDNSQWLERHGRLERELAQVRKAAEAQQQELDALRQTAAEHKALQARWTQDLQALEAAHTELTGARADAAKERERREQAEAEALRAGVRLETLEQLLAQLRPQDDKPETNDRSTVSTRETR